MHTTARTQHRSAFVGDSSARMFHRLSSLLLALCVMTGLLSPPAAPAQVSGGSITGTVTDPSGALIPGVAVRIVNRGTGLEKSLKTTSTGLFSQPNLDPGNYVVFFTLPGFSDEKAEAVVDVGHNTVLEVRLIVAGASKEVVDVTSESPIVDLGSTQLNQVVDGKTLRELPLNGRDWTSLSILEPNVHTVDNQNSLSAGDNSRSNRGIGTQISIGGTRPQQNDYRLDGIITNDYSGGGPGGALGGTLGVDAIQEFSVISSNATADYGRTSGGIISGVTRAGTNRLHGSAYEFIRNSALDARNYFSNTVAPLKRNQFGGTVGGPIFKDKAFFFFNYEGLRQSRTTATVDNVPSPAADAGVLVCTQAPATGTQNKSCLTAIGGPIAPAGTSGVQQYVVPASELPYLALYPQANGPISGDTGQWSFNSKSVALENLYTGRADYTFNPRDSIHATGLNDGSTDTQPDAFNFTQTGLLVTRRVYSLQESHQFSPNIANFARIGYAYTYAIAPASNTGISPQSTNNALGFVPGLPVGDLTIGGLTTFFGGVGTSGVYSFAYNSYQAADDVYLTRGAHSIQAGFSFEKIQSNDRGTVNNGLFTFGSLAAFFNNTPTGFTSNIPGSGIPAYLRQNVFGGYLTDSYHFRKNLTVTVGVRYEPISPVSEKYGHLGVLLNPTDPAATVVKDLYNNPSKLNFSPRVGFAWDPYGSGKTSVRAAYGIYDSLPLTYVFSLSTVTVSPFGSSATLTTSTLNAAGAPVLNGSFPFAAYPLAIANPTNKVAYVQQNFSRPYVQQYLFNVQQQLAKNLSLELGYTGAHGVRQPLKSNDINTVQPITSDLHNLVFPYLIPGTNKAGVTTYKTSGTKLNPSRQVGTEDNTSFNESTTYNALNAALRGSARNFRLGIAYTWSKSLDESSSSNGGTNFTNSLIAPFPNYIGRFKGLSDFNIQQNIVVNGLYTFPGLASSHPFVKAATAGFQGGGILRIASGLPFTPLISGDPLGLSSANTFDLPDRNYGPGCSGNPTDFSHKNDYQFLKRSCFSVPTTTPGPTPGSFYPRLGNLARNSIIGPGITTLDASLVKNTAVPRFGEAARIEFRAEAFNVLNHPNFQVPSRGNSTVYSYSATNAAFTPSNLQQLTVTSTPERQLQFGLKLIF